MDWLTKKIEVIKAVRRATGLGLREASDLVDKWWENIRNICTDAFANVGDYRSMLGDDVKDAINPIIAMFERCPNVYKMERDHTAALGQLIDNQLKEIDDLQSTYEGRIEKARKDHQFAVAEKDVEIRELKRRLKASEGQLGSAADLADKNYDLFKETMDKVNALCVAMVEVSKRK